MQLVCTVVGWLITLLAAGNCVVRFIGLFLRSYLITVKVFPVLYELPPMRAYEGLEVQLCVFIISALNEIEWLASCLCRLPSGKSPQYQSNTKRLGPKICVNALEKRAISCRLQESNQIPRAQSSSPQPGYHMDRAIPASSAMAG